MINVVVLIQLKEGSRETFLHEFQKVVPLVRDEQGCVEYGPTIDVTLWLVASVRAQGASRHG